MTLWWTPPSCDCRLMKAQADSAEDEMSKWRRDIVKVVEADCIGHLTLEIKRASLVQAMKTTGLLKATTKAIDHPQLYVCATLGECKVVTRVDPRNGKNPEWEVLNHHF